jgi:small GTP-binding protein
MKSLSDPLETVERTLWALGDHDRARRLSQLRRLFDHRSLRVVVFGEFSRGKSTLINALLGRVVLPAKLVPTTGHSTRLVYSRTEEIRVRDRNKQVTRHPLDRLDEFVLLDAEGSARTDVESLEVAVNHPLLQSGVAIIDTPGVGDRHAQTQRARFAMATGDLILFVLDAKQILSRAEQELAAEWRTLRKPVVLVVNFMNQIDESQRDEIRERVERWSRTNLKRVLERRWFEVNALGALKHALGIRKERPDDDQTVELREALAGCRGERRARLKEQARRGQLLAEVRAARAEIDAVLARLQADQKSLLQHRMLELLAHESRLRALAVLGPEHQSSLAAVAERTLQEAKQQLESGCLARASAPFLEASLESELKTRLFNAIERIERKAAENLACLAEDDFRSLSPMTLREEAELSCKIDPIPAGNDLATEGARFGGAMLAGVLGQLLVPVPGVGAMLGWLVWNLTASDPAAAARQKIEAALPQVREFWDQAAAKVLRQTKSQFAAQLQELNRRVVARIEAAQQLAETSTDELQHRLGLARAADHCEQILGDQPL